MAELTREDAAEFANSHRGHYILSQAPTVAIETLEKVEPPMRESSNIEDMRFIRDKLFPMYAEIHKAATWAAEKIDPHGTQRR
jgi:hypothetical protein